jgi:Ca2+-binding RTX toxin-like protein
MINALNVNALSLRNRPKQNATQKVTAENTTLISDGSEATKVRQKGAKSDDTLAGVTGEGASKRLRQLGKAGDDTLEASAGHKKGRVIQNAGQGNDTIALMQAEGKLRATINGGAGTDSASYEAGDKNVIIRNGAGQIIFKQGTGNFSTLRVSNVENFTVNGQVVATKLPPKGSKGMSAAFQTLIQAQE